LAKLAEAASRLNQGTAANPSKKAWGPVRGGSYLLDLLGGDAGRRGRRRSGRRLHGHLLLHRRWLPERVGGAYLVSLACC